MTKYDSIIDTLQIKLELSNVEDFTQINIGSFPYIKSRVVDAEKGTMTIGMSLNRRRGHYNRLNSLSEHIEEFNQMIDDFKIINKDIIELNRVDIAIDTNLDYYENFKFFLYMFELITYDDKKSDKWYTTNLETLQENTIKQYGRKREIEFYDKEDESRGRHLYKTRMEFRYKEIKSTDFIKHIDKVFNLVDAMTQNIELLNQNMSNRLIRLYNKEIQNKNVKSLSEFVRKFNKYIYTNEIMRDLYNKTGLTGNYENWIKRYRKSNKLEFISKHKVEQYKKDCIKSLKVYKEN